MSLDDQPEDMLKHMIDHSYNKQPRSGGGARQSGGGGGKGGNSAGGGSGGGGGGANKSLSRKDKKRARQADAKAGPAAKANKGGKELSRSKATKAPKNFQPGLSETQLYAPDEAHKNGSKWCMFQSGLQ